MFEDISGDIKDDDLLGRAVFSRRRAKQAGNGNVDFRNFFKPGSNKVSVDRFGFCSSEDLTGIQDKNAQSRSGPFYGWLQMTVHTARGMEKKRTVKASPEAGKNPYHADIILPDTVKDDDERRQHAKELASDKSIQWIPRYKV